jgi:bifunctional non-homologous end joining protein LigD
MFIAFDALAVAGRDLRHLPWRDRRRELETLLADAQGPVRIMPVLDADMRLHHALVADGWEGTVAKRVTARYRCGRRSCDWVKLKSPDAIVRDRARVEATLRRAGVVSS